MSTSSNVIARGIRISRSNLDAFLQRHNLHPSTPRRLFKEHAKAVSQLFARLGVQGKLRLLEPHLINFKPADHVFLCYDWVYVLAEKEVESSLKKMEPPKGFWEVVREIVDNDDEEAGKAKVGTWVLCIEEEWGLYRDEKFQDTETFRCGLCGDIFLNTKEMFEHLEEMHQQKGWVIPPC